MEVGEGENGGPGMAFQVVRRLMGVESISLLGLKTALGRRPLP